MGVLGDWRGCSRCGEMFFDGFLDNKGHCPAGGVHASAGFNFVLPHTTPPAGGPSQPGWQGCNKCSAMFFNGFTGNKGVCPADMGHHVAQSDNYFLPHDVPGNVSAQPDWHGCRKCGALFFDGFTDNKGRCPADSGIHEQESANFVLPHPITPTLRLVQDGTTVTVIGEHFTPFDKVHIHYQFDAESVFDGQEDANTDKDGEILTDGNAQFDVKLSTASAITVQATDHATGIQVTV